MREQGLTEIHSQPVLNAEGHRMSKTLAIVGKKLVER
jgi:hypothetical protein